MASHSWVVLKFGGTSVSTRKRWEVINKICGVHLKDNKRIIVVCSALSTVSNHLQNLIDLALKGDFHPTLSLIREKHLEFAHELCIEGAEDLLAQDFKKGLLQKMFI